VADSPQTVNTGLIVVGCISHPSFFASMFVQFASKPLATPSVVAMISLKLHDIEQSVLALVKAHQLSLDDPDFSASVLKHGGETAVTRIRAAIAGGN
jgi:hypothetical protein